MLKRGLLPAGLLLLAGCGYALVGRGSFLPTDVKVLEVIPFESRRFPELADQIRQAVIDEIQAQTSIGIKQRSEPADAVLEGEVVAASMVPVVFDEDGLATRQQASMTVSVLLKRSGSGDVLYENRGFSFRSEVETSENADNFYDAESELLEDISRQFARSLVAAMKEGF